MAIYRIFPLPEVEDLKIGSTLCDVSSFPGCESFAVIGDNPVLKSSLLLQAALSYVSNGDPVIFIRPGQFTTVPFPVEGMMARTTALLDCIKMVYISEPLGLIRYLCEIHMTGFLPSAIIIEDFSYFVTHHQEHNRDLAICRLYALLEDSTAYISKMRKSPCHRLISMSKPPTLKGSMKKYFREIWQLSFTEDGSEILLTDDHVPAFRIAFHVEEDKIILNKLFRLPAVENS